MIDGLFFASKVYAFRTQRVRHTSHKTADRQASVSRQIMVWWKLKEADSQQWNRFGGKRWRLHLL